MNRRDHPRGKRLVIAMLAIALAAAIAGMIFSRHLRHLPATQPSPLQSFW